uniref:Uncharacterized protein n=1 Tax=Cajanus cajan TaxID=3821 RepID=A0A151TYA3_CAJCA|nr:hypothetical protein KK1_011340 [Cajanus cajan]
MMCIVNATPLKCCIEKDRVYEFLATLYPEFDHVRVRILGKKDPPSLEETVSIV